MLIFRKVKTYVYRGGLVYLSLSGQILAYLGKFGIKIVVAF